eukprot:CAMPEP_0117740234 /NCGR_PEP_ID=MMETSP0947-20121206/4223_1 /TAXON_ID=44440 /ORGANISM="Chattonella subsalsa, Strain CCMP2191" /LENGTH=299 /DNA_ID=CAMNT_0005556315 /DNA_START=217 /DNA_END=1116 /DNA_ORIENTATION=-
MNLQVYEEKLDVRGQKLWYQISAPPVSQLINRKLEPRVPVICLHGGPGVPHDYLEPIRGLCEMDGRTVIFYDQFGCGNSDAPEDLDFYSVDLFREDLYALLRHLRDAHGLFAFHLFGQSWGGCLAAEAVLGANVTSLVDGMELLSVTLSGSPSSVKVTEKTVEELITSYNQQAVLEEYKISKTAEEIFRIKNYCRMDEIPKCFEKALSKGGKIFRGTDAIPQWDIRPKLSAWPATIPLFVLRGEHDFVDQQCFEDYDKQIKHSMIETIKDCSHLAHLENTQEFLAKLSAFLKSVEDKIN